MTDYYMSSGYKTQDLLKLEQIFILFLKQN